MTDIAVYHFASFDGVELCWREMGEGRPVVLLHGYFSDAMTNWIRYGHAAAIAGRGYRVIMPDLRGHGDSGKPHDPASYPPDTLARDGLALIDHLGLTDYDLGGYSLGARTTMRLLVHGATPRRVVLSGMGLEGIVASGRRADFFRRVLAPGASFERGSPEFMAQAFLKTTGGDATALALILDTFVDTEAAALDAVTQPVLVVCGADDRVNGSAPDLADALLNGRYVEVPGHHMSAVIKPELGQAIADFLAG